MKQSTYVVVVCFPSIDCFPTDIMMIWDEISCFNQVILGALPLAVDYVNSNKDLLKGKILEYHAVNIGTDATVLSSNTIK